MAKPRKRYMVTSDDEQGDSFTNPRLGNGEPWHLGTPRVAFPATKLHQQHLISYTCWVGLLIYAFESSPCAGSVTSSYSSIQYETWNPASMKIAAKVGFAQKS